MFSGGIRNPVLQLRIALAIALISWAFIAWGVLEMRAAGWEDDRSSGTKIGLAALPAIIGTLMVFNFWYAVRLVAAMRRGENVLARWHIDAEALAAFMPENTKRDGHGAEYVNDWKPPRAPPPDGIDIIFGADCVVAHDSYFALVGNGPYRFLKVGLLPHSPRSIEFVTVTTFSSVETTTRRFTAVLRLPLPQPQTQPSGDCPDASGIVDHYRRVLAGTVVANPNFYRRRIRIGLIGAAMFLPVALIGLMLELNGAPDRGDLPSILLIVGIILGGTAMILALLAAYLDRRQRRRG